MKFFELAKCLKPAVPTGLSRALNLRELISEFSTVTEDEWGTNRNPSTLPSNSVLESMTSRPSGLTKKLANAICPRLDIDAFVERLHGLDLTTQELIAKSIAAHDDHVELENFEYDVADTQVIHLDDGVEALYDFTWNTEILDYHDPQPSEGGHR